MGVSIFATQERLFIPLFIIVEEVTSSSPRFEVRSYERRELRELRELRATRATRATYELRTYHLSSSYVQHTTYNSIRNTRQTVNNIDSK